MRDTLLLFLCALPLAAQVHLRSSTQEVLLDFTVRDKHQNLVTDLADSDITVFENGVPQKITSFRFRNGAGATRSSASNTAATGKLNSTYEPLRDINVVTIVFAAIGPDSRQRAVEFVDEFLTGELPQNTWIGVFGLRPNLMVIQPYTTDFGLLKKAVYRAVQGSPSDLSREYDQALMQLERLAAAQNKGTFRALRPGSAEQAGPAENGRTAGLERQLARVTLQILFQREGPRTLDALRSLEKQQATIPGRKTILFVSEGLIVPPDQAEPLKGIIAESNRNNVTFYTLDARGLSTRELAASQDLANGSLSSAEGPNSGLFVQHSDFQQNARELAERTGGFSMENSNDLKAPLRRVMEDVRAHYEVTYAPTSSEYNGSFRKIEVKVKRNGMLVHSRSGYYALPLLLGMEVQPFEIAALRALQTSPLPRDFPFRAAAFRFGPDPEGIAHRIAVEIPIESLQAATDPLKNTFRVRVSVLALVKDDRGEILAKAVRDLPYEAPVARLPEFQKGNFSMVLPLDLTPGKYHLDLVVLDRVGEKTSTRRSVLVVPETRSPDTSDLVWVRGVQPIDTADRANPFDTQQGRITPKIAPDFTAADAPRFLFRVYEDQATAQNLTAHLTILKDRAALVSTDLPAATAEADGSLLFAGTIPAGALPSGEYDVVISTKQGEHTARLESHLVIQ